MHEYPAHLFGKRTQRTLTAALFIPTELLSQSVAAAAVGMINAVGSVAGFEGPYLFGYLNTRTGSFSYGLALMMVSAIAGGLLIPWAPRSAQSAAQSAHEADQLAL